MENPGKKSRYLRLIAQLDELTLKSNDPVARMATITAILYHKTDYYFWAGFYILKSDQLIVGPYQGPVACQILENGKGVCWASVKAEKPVIVEDVDKFPGHIACDSRSRSEIVIPVFNSGHKLMAVFDGDARKISQFDDSDREMLEEIMKFIYRDPVNTGV